MKKKDNWEEFPSSEELEDEQKIRAKRLKFKKIKEKEAKKEKAKKNDKKNYRNNRLIQPEEQ